VLCKPAHDLDDLVWKYLTLTLAIPLSCWPAETLSQKEKQKEETKPTLNPSLAKKKEKRKRERQKGKPQP
jgi:hypothetical protein